MSRLGHQLPDTVSVVSNVGRVHSERGSQTEGRALLRDRLLDAAAELTCAEGWAGVTMGRLAARVGVSRQTVHKEVGTRQALGQALVVREADRFLAGVREQMAAHPGGPVSGIGSAVEYTLRGAADNALLKAILSSPLPGAEELLPLLAVRPEPVLQHAISAVLEHARTLYPDLAEAGQDELAPLIEIIVRLTLSHLQQPLGPVEDAVEQARRIVQRWL